MLLQNPPHALHTLYAAARREAAWRDALKDLSFLTGSQGATVWLMRGRQLPQLEFYNFSPPFIRAYVDVMAAHDPTVQFITNHPSTRITREDQIIADREKQRHAYYRWQSLHTDSYHRLLAKVPAGRSLQLGIALHRNKQAGSYDDRDRKQLAILYPDIACALSLGLRRDSLRGFCYLTKEQHLDQEILATISAVVAWKNKSGTRAVACSAVAECIWAIRNLAETPPVYVRLLAAIHKQLGGHAGLAREQLEGLPNNAQEATHSDVIDNSGTLLLIGATRAWCALDSGNLPHYFVQTRLLWNRAQQCNRQSIWRRCRDLYSFASRMCGHIGISDCLSSIHAPMLCEPALPNARVVQLLWECITPPFESSDL